MRLLVCGSRDWYSPARVLREIGQLAPKVVIHGGARGADIMAAEAATLQGRTVLPFPADWNAHGKAAGPIRNEKMLREGKPDRGLAFGALWRQFEAPERKAVPRLLWKLTGTGDMVRRMLAAGLPVRWVHYPEAAAVDLVAMPEPPP